MLLGSGRSGWRGDEAVLVDGGDGGVVLCQESKDERGGSGRQGVEGVERERTEDERKKEWREEKGGGECSEEEGLVPVSWRNVGDEREEREHTANLREPQRRSIIRRW